MNLCERCQCTQFPHGKMSTDQLFPFQDCVEPRTAAELGQFRAHLPFLGSRSQCQRSSIHIIAPMHSPYPHPPFRFPNSSPAPVTVPITGPPPDIHHVEVFSFTTLILVASANSNTFPSRTFLRRKPHCASGRSQCEDLIYLDTGFLRSFTIHQLLSPRLPGLLPQRGELELVKTCCPSLWVLCRCVDRHASPPLILTYSQTFVACIQCGSGIIRVKILCSIATSLHSDQG